MRAYLLAAAFVGFMTAAADDALMQSSGSSTPAIPPIEGVWRGTISVTTGANASSNPNRLPNIIIYTKRHYSVLSQDASVPRPPRKAIDPPKDADNLTVDEKLSRYELWLPIVATAGEYELSGTMLTHRPVVAKGLATEQSFEVIFEGRDRFIQIAKSGIGRSASETRRTFVRVE